jgi:hypothetical protein
LSPTCGGQDHDHPETLPKNAAEENASKDNVPGNYITADKSDDQNDMDGDHTHPDEGGVPKTPEEGDAQKSLDRKMSKKLFQRTTLILQAEISAGMTKNQPAAPADQGPKTTLNSAPAAKTDKSEVGKKEDEPPEVSKPARDKSEMPTDDNPNIKELKAANKPMETLTKPGVVDTSAIEDPAPLVATEASPALEPGGYESALKDIVPTLAGFPKQNRKTTKNNKTAQVQGGEEGS